MDIAITDKGKKTLAKIRETYGGSGRPGVSSYKRLKAGILELAEDDGGVNNYWELTGEMHDVGGHSEASLSKEVARLVKLGDLEWVK